MVSNMSKENITYILRNTSKMFDEFGGLSNGKIQVVNVLIED